MADNSRALRALRRVGIGLSGAGPLGAFGANVELNFTPDIGFLTGFGGGPGYQAYTFQLKRVFGEASLAPYLVGGYARWYSFGESGRPISDTTPGFLQTKFLSAKQKAEGRIDENLLYPGFGLQYLTLSGPYAGSSVFAELLLLTDIGDFVVAPTGTVGYMYYF
ncbi:MAG: hypothetical protein NDI61_09890 [Bdellovibrionaceae bacterium]|nr:hypothetical protein [Pseudobdellovibrionaceae bacterium]